MKEKSAIEQGWDFAANMAGMDFSAHAGYEYVSKVSEAIKELEDNINNHSHRFQDLSYFKGYAFEEWAAGSFNVNAIAAGSSDRANVLHSNAKWSVDIALNSGDTYSAKVYSNAEASAKAQAKFNHLSGKAIYDGQHRLIPADHLQGAIEKANDEALRNTQIRPDVAKAYQETRDNLTDRIKNNEGIESLPKNKSEIEKIANEGKKQEFKASNHGITEESVITQKNMLHQTFKAGCTAATITMAMQMAPEIYKAIDYLIKHGEINVHQVKQMGTKAITSSAEGFIRGSVACYLMMMFEKGVFGETLKAISPTLLGSVVAIVMGTLKNSILVSIGKMSPGEMGASFVNSLIVTAGMYGGVAIGKSLISSTEIGKLIGGIIGQFLGFQVPLIGYLIGSLIGCAFVAVYEIGKKKIISLCVDSGFTCFGLVEQNYELPEEVLSEIGVDTIRIPRTNIARNNIKTTNVSLDIEKTNYETIDLTMLRRGVIGVRKIGYIF